jgi:hypothetical protein
VDQLTPDLLSRRYPRLWHMAEEGSWPSIRRHGLLSTTALLDRFEVEGAERDAIESYRRTRTIAITHPLHGTAWIRDNLPINETVLRRTLKGMSEPEFYRLLNGRVFFWVSEARLHKLRRAGAYKARRHDVLEIDTARLLERHGQRAELSHLNSGAVHPAADYPRGEGTFQPIDRYLWVERKRISPSDPLVELTVPYSVPDIEDLVVSVTTV